MEFFQQKKNYNMRCSSRKCSRASAVYSLYKVFALSNIFFYQPLCRVFLKSSPDIESLILDANTELKKAAKWFQAYRLSLNVSKTKYIVFRNRNMHFEPNSWNISTGNEILERIGNECVNKYFKT